MKITLAMLKEKCACANQVAEFARRFGDEVEVTEQVCVSVASVFNWDWAARHFLTAAAWAAYREAKAAAWAAYDEATAAAGAAYDEATAAAGAAYREATAPARAAYSKARARAFARLLDK